MFWYVDIYKVGGKVVYEDEALGQWPGQLSWHPQGIIRGT